MVYSYNGRLDYSIRLLVEILITSDMQMTPLMAESDELKSLLMKVRGE